MVGKDGPTEDNKHTSIHLDYADIQEMVELNDRELIRVELKNKLIPKMYVIKHLKELKKTTQKRIAKMYEELKTQTNLLMDIESSLKSSEDAIKALKAERE